MHFRHVFTSSALSALVTAHQCLLHDQSTQHQFLCGGALLPKVSFRNSSAVDRVSCPFQAHELNEISLG